MSTPNEQLPKDLPITNPLLFSFLMAIDANKSNVTYDGATEGGATKGGNSFKYAVNKWRTVQEAGPDAKNPIEYLEQDVLAVIWRQKPKITDIIKWCLFPNGDPTCKKRDTNLSFKLPFESWRNTTFNELDQIIKTLTAKSSKDPYADKREHGRKLKLLGDIYDWNIKDGKITYVYAKDSTCEDMFGVGAAFTIRSCFYNCCPDYDRTKVDLRYFRELGFVFDGIEGT
jgi:hypothetical protein